MVILILNIALDVGLNEESQDNVENIAGDVTGSEREGINFQEEAVDAHFNNYVYTTHEKATHINHDHCYAYVECATDTEVSNDSNLEATAAVEAFENEGELPNVFNVVFQNASSCEGEAHFDDAAVNENEKVTQLLFSLKEKPPTQQDREIHGTSVNDIIYSSYLERKQITKEFLSFLYSEDGSNKENDESVGNIMVTDEFGACKEMEAGGLLTFARNKVVHLEPLLVQKIILYSSPSSEPIFCTMENTIIVNQEQQDDTIELHYWSTTENDNANEEVTFNEDNSIKKEEVNSNEENNWGSGFSLGGEATMDAMEPNYVVVGLVGPQDVQHTGEYHSNLYARNLEECTENSSGDASEGYCDYYGEPAVHQGDLSVNGGHPENQDYFRDFLVRVALIVWHSFFICKDLNVIGILNDPLLDYSGAKYGQCTCTWEGVPRKRNGQTSGRQSEIDSNSKETTKLLEHERIQLIICMQHFFKVINKI